MNLDKQDKDISVEKKYKNSLIDFFKECKIIGYTDMHQPFKLFKLIPSEFCAPSC